jgi:nitrogen fixation NifU-like protein
MDIKHLYQDIIVDHNKSPRNFHRLDPADRQAEGFNPLCGDKLSIFLRLDGDRISEVSFEGSGCAISVASASLMTECLKGRTLAEAKQLFDQMHNLLTGRNQDADLESLGKLGALAGVRDYPSRVKCATLCWHTLHAAMNKKQSITTE